MSWLSSIVGVLFVGHSLFGQTNPQMLKDVLQQAAPQAEVSAQIINGAPLKHNWDHGADTDINARDVLGQGDTNVVILTEAIPLQNHLDWSGTAEYAQKYYDLAVKSRPDTRVFLQETWHNLLSGTGAEVLYDDGADVPWRDRLDQDLAKWRGIVTAVNAGRAGETPEMVLIPAGQAMARLDSLISEGAVAGLSDIRDVFADDIHPNDIGFYFLTMLQYAVLTGESPVGLPHRLSDPWGGSYKTPNAELAKDLQSIAWAVAETEGAVPGDAPPVAASATGADAGDPPPADTLPIDPVPVDPTSVDTASDTPGAIAPAFYGPVPLSIGLSGVTDWSAQSPFLDVMKTARPWIGHLPRQWGGVTHEDLEAAGYLDDHGWPLEKPPELGSIGTMLLTDMPEQAMSLAGRYRLRFEGNGIIEVRGRAKNVRYGKNEVQFDYAPGPGSVDVRIQRTDRTRSGDYVRNITVVKLDHVAAYDAGAVFNPVWLDRLMGFQTVRFMDWMLTNHSTQSTWANRPKPDDYTYSRKGVPIEIMVELANRVGVDAWFTMPHLADDDYVRQFAQTVKDTLWHDLKTYVEFSNEVWNWQFQQAVWADKMALERWGKKNAWLQFYIMRASEIADIWADVYGAEKADRLVRVITTQTGWLGLEVDMLAAPLWVAETPDAGPPTDHFDAYAVTGYFGGGLGLEDRWPMIAQWIEDSRLHALKAADERDLTGEARAVFLDAHQYDTALAQAAAELRDGIVSDDPEGSLSDLVSRVFPYHAEVAQRHGLDMIMYEGGTHVVGIGPMVDNGDLTAFLHRLNYSAEMGALYTDLINGWRAAGGTLFNAYVDVYAPTKWGSWGTLRYLTDDNPRWDALESFK